MENHQVCRVGDGQHKRRGIGDQSAHEEIRQRLRPGSAYRRQDGWRQHYCCRIVGHKDRDQRPDAVDEGEEPGAGPVGAPHGDR